MTFIDTDTSAGERREHPVDVVERLAAINEWTFDRAETDEISILVSGKFANYDDALAVLGETDAPRWRRPNPNGNWGIVIGRRELA